MSQLIQAGITAAQSEGRVIDQATARRIAACLHRGLGGELEHFAGTGQIVQPQVAREELFYATAGEQQFTVWRIALRAYVNRYVREQRQPGNVARKMEPKQANRQTTSGQAVSSGAKHRPASALSPLAPTTQSAKVDRAAKPVSPPAPVNPESCGDCDPGAAVVYLRTDAKDRVKHQALALHMQDQACRNYVKRHLHRRVEATFADRLGSRLHGLRLMLSHLAICHNQRVVVHRLDRLANQATRDGTVAIHQTGARVLSVSEQAPRGVVRQNQFLADMADLAQDSAKTGGSHD
jgi:hypothetical protein